MVPPVRCFSRTKARLTGYTFPPREGECGTPVRCFSVLRPDGLGPHFLPRECECGNPRTMFFFRTRSPLPLHTRVNMVINYHISVRTGLISRWNGYPLRAIFRTKLKGSIFLP